MTVIFPVRRSLETLKYFKKQPISHSGVGDMPSNQENIIGVGIKPANVAVSVVLLFGCKIGISDGRVAGVSNPTSTLEISSAGAVQLETTALLRLSTSLEIATTLQPSDVFVQGNCASVDSVTAADAKTIEITITPKILGTCLIEIPRGKLEYTNDTRNESAITARFTIEWPAPGTIVRKFGNRGSVAWEVTAGKEIQVRSIVMNKDESAAFVLAEIKDGSTFTHTIRKYNVDGSLETTFGTNGAVEMSATSSIFYPGLYVAHTGKGAENFLYYYYKTSADAADIRVRRISPEGKLSNSFATNGELEISASPPNPPPTPAITNDKYYPIQMVSDPAMERIFLLVSQGDQITRIVAFDYDGDLISTFGQAGVSTHDIDADSHEKPLSGSFHIEDGYLLFSVLSYDGGLHVNRIDSATSAIDSNFGESGVVTITGKPSAFDSLICFWPNLYGQKFTAAGTANRASASTNWRAAWGNVSEPPIWSVIASPGYFGLDFAPEKISQFSLATNQPRCVLNGGRTRAAVPGWWIKEDQSQQYFLGVFDVANGTFFARILGNQAAFGLSDHFLMSAVNSTAAPSSTISLYYMP
jgi:hypothetical protein